MPYPASAITFLQHGAQVGRKDIRLDERISEVGDAYQAGMGRQLVQRTIKRCHAAQGGVTVIFNAGHAAATGVYKGRFHCRGWRQQTVGLTHDFRHGTHIAKYVYPPQHITPYRGSRQQAHQQKQGHHNKHQPTCMFQNALFHNQSGRKDRESDENKYLPAKKNYPHGKYLFPMRITAVHATENLRWSSLCSKQMPEAPIARFAYPCCEGLPAGSPPFHHCKNGGTHGRPGMAAVMRVSGFGTASANLLPISEAPAIQPVERSDNALVICLIECD